MAKIKICGLQSLEDVSYVNEANVDFAGFIFAHGSKRCIYRDIARQMKDKLNGNIRSVGVFVNEEISTVKAIAEENILDIIQLHGNETNEYIEIIKEQTNLSVIKAFKADKNLNENIENTSADYVLIDSSSGNKFGGTGKTFDYGLIPKTNKPLFIAGGLNIKNIEKALDLAPFCVDVNSGVETNGKKDKQKLFELVEKIRGYKS